MHGVGQCAFELHQRGRVEARTRSTVQKQTRKANPKVADC